MWERVKNTLWGHMPSRAQDVAARDRRIAAMVWPVAVVTIALVHGWVQRRQGDEISVLETAIHALPWAIAAGVILLIPVLGAHFYLWVLRAFGVVGFVVSNLLMTLIFFLVVTPIGFYLRLSGKASVDTIFRSAEPPRWRPHPRPADARRYYRLF